MAKELPFFKFEPAEWQNGNIKICEPETQALFIDLCCLYWTRLGNVPYALALQKLFKSNIDAMQELEMYDIISYSSEEKDAKVIIKFLDEQLAEFSNTSEKRRKAANERWSKANAMQMHSKSNAIREDKRIKEKNRVKSPTIDEVKKYFKEKGYTEESALKAFEYYAANDWKDSTGKPVKSWKQKMIAVWFKPENKIKPKNNAHLFMS